MKESPRAAQAWADYLAMGPGRSLERLLDLYQSGTKAAPTNRLTTLKLWSTNFGWQARLQVLAGEEARKIAERESAAREQLQALGIASRDNRVAAANERWRLLREVIAGRADDPEMEHVPGGTTGLLAKSVKVVGNGPTAYETGEYSVDVGLLKEMREHEKQVAQDLGQWTEKVAPTSPDGMREYAHDSLAALRAAELAYLAAIGVKPADLGLREGDDHSPDAR